MGNGIFKDDNGILKAVLNIDGAAVFPEMKKATSKDGEPLYKFPKINKEYKYFSVMRSTNGDLWPIVTKDLKEWVFPIAVLCGEEELNPMEIAERLKAKVDEEIGGKCEIWDLP